jgi:hypothetical protein
MNSEVIYWSDRSEAVCFIPSTTGVTVQGNVLGGFVLWYLPLEIIREADMERTRREYGDE